MDEKTAWQSFYATGKIEDYIRYSQLKNQAAAWKAAGMEDNTGENKHTGADYPGADHWGK